MRAFLEVKAMADEFDGLDESSEDGGAPPLEQPAPTPAMTEEELAAARAEYRRLARQNTGHALPAHAANFDELLALADQLKPADTEGIESVIERGVQMNLNDIQNGRLKATIRDRTKLGLRTLARHWQKTAARATIEKVPTPSEALEIEAELRWREGTERNVLRQRLWQTAAPFANRPDLIEHAADTVQALGVVGERKAIKANYLAMSSRVLAEPRVISVLDTGITAAGKSFLMNTVAKLFPAECVKSVTTGSPKALVYLVDKDSRALAHKIILLHETAGFIAASDTEDNPSAALVRELLTGGRIRHIVVEKEAKGRFVTREVEVEGPVSLITTSARANLDPEMENRFLTVPTDESPKATREIQMAQLSGETRRSAERAAKAVEELVAFQRWLQSEAGVRVVIPDELLDACAAVGGMPLTVQTRRDLPLFKLAIMTCAAIHMARRKRDVEGRLLAEFEDYEAAHDAIDDFLAASYSTKLEPSEIAVLAAIETLIAEDQKRRAAIEGALKPGEGVPMDHLPSKAPKARLTYDMIAARLQMKSRNTLARRVKALRLAKAISVVTEHQGHGARSSTWELLIPAARALVAKGGRFMPLPSDVAEMLADPAARRRRLDQIIAENGSLPDWRTRGDAENADAEDAVGGCGAKVMESEDGDDEAV
jgi:hypothetical protein